MKKPSRTHASSPDLAARELLSARNPDLGELIAAIRAVNPTGRTLAADLAESRYALKSALQSLLLRRWHEDLAVEPDARDPDVVLLRHRHLGLDACHASLRRLDEDARTLAEQILAEPSAPSGPTTTRTRGASRDTPPETPLALLRAGRDALDAYDFDVARARFEAAFARSGGSVESARALLELLVDHLAEDAEALELLRQLPDAAARDVSVRDLLAIAAARSGDLSTAQTLVRDGTSPRAGEVLALLARGALDRDDVVAAQRFAHTLRVQSPAHPSLRGIEDAVDALRRQLRAPREAQVTGALAHARWDDAERLAHELLRDFSDSEVARRALAAVAQRRTEREVAALTESATEAIGRGDIDAAARALVALHQRGAGVPRLDAALHALREQSQHASRVAARDALIAQWRRGERAEVLRAWPTLELAVQQSVVEVLHDPEFAWVEAIAPHRAPLGDAALAAVLALRDLVDRGDAMSPAEQLAALSPHERALHRLPVANEVLQRARAAIRHAALTARAERFAALDAAIDGGRLDDARSLHAALLAEDLDAEARASLAARSERIATCDRFALLDDAVERAVREDDPLHAHANLRLRRMLHDTPEVAARAETLRRAMVRRWPCRRFEAPASLAMLHQAAHACAFQSEATQLLSDDGTIATIPVVLGHFVFVTRVRVDDGGAIAAWMLRLPEVLYLPRVRIVGDTLELQSSAMACGVDLARGELAWWLDLRAHVAENDIVEEVALLPGGQVAYLHTRSRAEGERACLIDVARGVVLRETIVGMADWVPGVDGVALLVTAFDDTRFFDERGRPARWPRPQRDRPMVAAVAHPEGRGLVGITHLAERVWITHTAPDGAPSESLVLPDVHPDSGATIACSLHHARVVVVTKVEEGGRVYVVRDASRALGVERMSGVDGPVALLCDRASRHVALLGATRDGARLADLETLSDAWCASLGEWEVGTGVLSTFGCRDPHVGRAPTRVRDEVRSGSGDDPEADADALLARFGHDARELCDVYEELRAVKRFRVSDALGRKGVARHPRHWPLVRAAIRGFEYDNAWDDLAALLTPVAAQPDAPQHLLHLYGIALLYRGHHAEGEEVLRRAAQVKEGSCELDDALAVATWRTADPHSPREGTRLAITIASLDAADDAFARNDLRGVVAALDRAPFVGSDDTQVLVRLAAAYLALDDGACDPLRKAVALASLVASKRERALGPRSFPLVGAWDDARVEAVTAEAAAWLGRALHGAAS